MEVDRGQRRPALGGDDLPVVVADHGHVVGHRTAEVALNTADFDPQALDTGKVGGKQYAVPTGLATYAMVVNTDLLAKYKIPLPDDATWTWDDLRAVGAKVSAAGGGAVTGVQS